jgi:hypothetical protein
MFYEGFTATLGYYAAGTALFFAIIFSITVALLVLKIFDVCSNSLNYLGVLLTIALTEVFKKIKNLLIKKKNL